MTDHKLEASSVEPPGTKEEAEAVSTSKGIYIYIYIYIYIHHAILQ